MVEYCFMRAFEETINYGAESRILSLNRKDKEFAFAWHFHDAFEITLVNKGKGQRFIGNNISPYEEGDIVLVPPGIPHTWQSDPSSRINDAYVIQFNESCLGDSFKSEDFREVKELLIEHRGYAFQSSKTLLSSIKVFHESRGLNRVIKFLELLSLLNKCPKSVICTGEYTFSPEKEGSQKLDAIMKYLNTLAGRAPNVPELASKLGMSESTFRRFIKRYTGKSLITFYNELCITKACKLLIETDNSISDISFSCGYRNLSHFNRVFKSLKEITPRDYRKKLK